MTTPGDHGGLLPHHRVAIVGAGLGGLVAARVLQVHGVPVTVFEGEASREARVQGGMLDIHAESGQVALRAAALFDAFRALVHPGGQAMRILDGRATVLREDSDDEAGDRPEVDRGQLRDLLLDALAEGTVRWGAKVVAVTPDPRRSGRHRVELADGSAFTTDLLVGADGAWSRVRPLLTDARPAYAGVSFVEADLVDADLMHPAEAAAVGGACSSPSRVRWASWPTARPMAACTSTSATAATRAGATPSTGRSRPRPRPPSSSCWTGGTMRSAG